MREGISIVDNNNNQEQKRRGEGGVFEEGDEKEKEKDFDEQQNWESSVDEFQSNLPKIRTHVNVNLNLDSNNKPYISSMDSIGAESVSRDFAAVGTNSESLLGMCESIWKPDMDADELFETLAQGLLSGVNRDALAGWGAVIYLITPEKVVAKTLRGRMD
eukprot:TRINITY_DN11686_c1_g1_i3.p1 TRINITY_DN11686_c1_g1~~TRINITY_DN11686_c1_g1_i3.p1  ORF type:complete len:160 (-),score=44.21 TRINITY_DN11686_c1_g1_i3:221-700(-)